MSNTFQRMEKKTTLQASVAEEFKAFIAPHMIPDDNCPDGSPYTVCNLYFDDDDDHVIRRSIELPYYKEKLRLRSYGVPTLDTKVFLELKKSKAASAPNVVPSSLCERQRPFWKTAFTPRDFHIPMSRFSERWTTIAPIKQSSRGSTSVTAAPPTTTSMTPPFESPLTPI